MGGWDKLVDCQFPPTSYLKTALIQMVILPIPDQGAEFKRTSSVYLCKKIWIHDHGLLQFKFPKCSVEHIPTSQRQLTQNRN